MATAKTTTLTFHINPAVKDALRMAAEREHRFIANMVEVVSRDYCGRNGVPIHESERTIAPSRGRRGKGK